MAELKPSRTPRGLGAAGKAYWRGAVKTFAVFQYPWTQTDLAQLHEVCRIVDLQSEAHETIETDGLISSDGRPAAAFKILKDLQTMRLGFERGLQLTRFTRKTRDVHPKAEPETKPESQTAKVIDLLANRK